MSKYLSDQNQFAFFYESGAYATVSGARQWVGLVQDHTPDESTNVIQVRYQGSTNRNVDVFEDGNLDYTGTFTYFPQDWKFLGFAIGSVTETGSAAIGSHVFTEVNSDDVYHAIPGQSLASVTLEDSKNNGTAGSNFITTIKGAMVNSMTTTFTQGGIVSVDIDYMAQDKTFTSGAIVAVTPVTTRPYMFSDTQLIIPSGTPISNVTEMTFTINNNLEAGHYLNGSRVAQEFLPLNREYELAATVTMDSVNAKTFYDKYFIGGSEFNCIVQSVGAPGSMYITLSGCKMNDMDTPSPVEGIQEQSLTIIPKTASVIVFDDIDNYNSL